MGKIIDLVIPILSEKPLLYDELITKINRILISQNEEITSEKLKKSIDKLIGKSIYKWRNGYFSLKKSPNTEDLEKLKLIPDINKVFCQTYFEDLETLESWNNDVDEKTMRQMSPIVRRILVENDLQILWKHLGFHKQPKLNTPNLKSFLDKINPNQITLLSAGGAKHNGMQVEKFILFNFQLTEKDIDFLNKNSKPERIELSLDDFMTSTCLVVEGEQITRRDVIKYIANKLGGNHFDSSRNIVTQEDENLIKKYKKLDKISNLNLTNLKTVYFELLSIVQCLFLSEDIKKLISKIKEVISPQ